MMHRLRVLRALAPIPVAAAVVIWRTGYAAPLLYGARCWTAALNPLAPMEDDAVG